MKKADESRCYNAEVFVLVQRHDRCHEYPSAATAEWPSTRAQAVGLACFEHGVAKGLRFGCRQQSIHVSQVRKKMVVATMESSGSHMATG